MFLPSHPLDTFFVFDLSFWGTFTSSASSSFTVFTVITLSFFYDHYWWLLLMQPHLVLLHSVGWLKKNKEVNLSRCCWPTSWFRPDPASCETAPSASDKLACGCKRRNQFFFRCFVWKQKEVFTVVYGGWQGKGPSHLLSWPRPTATHSLNWGQELCVFKSGRKWLVTSLPTPRPPRERNCQEQLLEMFQAPSDSPQAAVSEAGRGLPGLNHICWVIIWGLLPFYSLILCFQVALSSLLQKLVADTFLSHV